MPSPEEFFNQGVEYCKQKKYYAAIDAFRNAENSSANTNCPSASYNLGIVLENVGLHKKAKHSYEKAIADNGGQFPQASYAIGLLLASDKQFEKAKLSFEKAIDDNKSVYPKASYSLAMLLEKMNQYDLAKLSFEKAINDNGGEYPDASNNLGALLRETKQYKAAKLSFEKAINDNGGKHPDASNNLGVTLEETGQYVAAKSSYEKAIDDNMGKHPDASFNLGVLYLYYYNNYDNAIEAFYKAITDSEKPLPLAHLHLSKALLKSDHNEAKQHAFIALSLKCREYKYVEHIPKNFCIAATERYYKNRLHYIDVELEADIGEALDKENAARLINRQETPDLSSLNLFQQLLKAGSVNFPEPISRNEQLKLAYLTHYLHNEPWHTFHIIDRYIDGRFELDGMDQYFYLLTALEIAEPVDELSYYVQEKNINKDDPFYDDLTQLTHAVKKAIENEDMYDPYLLKVELPKLSSKHFHGNSLPYHSWINKVLTAIVYMDLFYEIPVSATQLEKLSSELLGNILEKLKTGLYSEDKRFYNLKRSLEVSAGERNYEIIIDNIRKAIKDGIPYYFILGELFELYVNETDEAEQHNIVILQTATMISHHVDHLKKSLTLVSKLEIPTTTIADFGVHTGIESFVACVTAVNIGIGIAVGFAAKYAFSSLKNAQIKNTESVFNSLLEQLKIPEQ